MAEILILKRCPRCKQTKPISEFYKCPGRKDGHEGWCKQCKIEVSLAYHKTERGKKAQKTAGQNYYKTKHGNQKVRKDVARYRKRHPEKIKAQNKVNNAIEQNRLPRPDTLRCHCGNRAEQYHHHKGYAPKHWFDVIPVCCKCHHSIHHKL